ncbi:MAG: hypothetical protein IT337_17680 [Thermomicrobiales bacterium]|nr:hypothetical protein [Thermomicrobiales bacterium]
MQPNDANQTRPGEEERTRDPLDDADDAVDTEKNPRGLFGRIADSAEGPLTAAGAAIDRFSRPRIPSAAEIDAARADLAAASADLDPASPVAPTKSDGSTERGRDWLSVSNDNTPEGRLHDVVNGGPIAIVRDGMHVVDVNGEAVGKVKAVRMGNATAATVNEAIWREDDSIIDRIARVVLVGSDEALPETVRNQLRRVGFIFIDGKGWLFDHDSFASAEQIARVEGETVYLNVPKEELPVV